MVNKFRIKWFLSSYFSLPAKLLFIQSGIFGPTRAPPGRFDNIFINIQLIIDESLPQGFPNQINEAFTKVNMFVMQQYRIAQLVEHPAKTDQLS